MTIGPVVCRHRPSPLIHAADEGLTGLELLILCALVLCGLYLVLHLTVLAPAGGDDRGVVVGAMEEGGSLLIEDGEVYGFADDGGPYEGVAVTGEGGLHPDMMGAVLVSVRLATGDLGGVDLSSATVTMTADGRTAPLSLSAANRPLDRGQWTVASRSHVIPFRQADDDLVLEPNEIFEVLLYPEERLAPNTRFTVGITAEGGMPFSLRRTVPPAIRSVMDLG
ncbi:hypothetical protein [Methanovulcanius yangii]|uniref:hypothetical protein n=1 Tax=Methanovulcanius yangii TaxID=1789227 RepID=UPI0029C9F78F|nr:hypothetical protein [Methanovulcanius yangii]